MAVRPIPPGYHTITPFLTVHDGDAILEFVKRALDARELSPPTRRADGRLAHAELRIGDSNLMLSEGTAEWPPMPCSLYLYVPGVDAVYAQAIAAGATSVRAPTDEYYGDRSAGVKDSSGNYWWIATHIEDVAPDELARRAAARGK